MLSRPAATVLEEAEGKPRAQEGEVLAMSIRARFGFVLEYVADVEAAKRFYVDVLGLAVERVHPTFVQFRDSSGARFAIASDESLTGNDERELYWVVDDAEAAFAELSRKAEVS